MRRNALKKCLMGFLVFTQVIPTKCFATDPPLKVARLLPWTTRDHGKRPKTAQDPSIEELAKNIDWLENRLNLYGTAVAKSPDVWGEARLTAHRQEFEEVLKNELRLFSKNQLNGAEYVSDQSFLAFALALKSQPTGTPAAPVATISSSITTAIASVDAKGDPKVELNSNFTGPTSAFGVTQDKITLGSTITVEQTEILDQMARYVNHLHSIRRINEGDDTSDSPGYAMNLVRVPVSIMPGHHTKQGYGVEITMTATPYHGPELLPVSFRDFVINDLIDHLAIPIARFINAHPQRVDDLMQAYTTWQRAPFLVQAWNQEMGKTKLPPGIGSQLTAERFSQAISGYRGGLFFRPDGQWKGEFVTLANLADLQMELLRIQDAIERNTATAYATVADARSLRQAVQGMVSDRSNNAKARVQYQNFSHEQTNSRQSDQYKDVERAIQGDYPNVAIETISQLTLGTKANEDIKPKLEDLTRVLESVNHIQNSVRELGQVMDHLPAGTTRRSTLPFPPTQLLCNYGMEDLANFTASLYGALREDLINREVVHVTDIQAYLREELGAAYELLGQEAMFHWWDEAANGQSTLAADIRLRRTAAIAETRQRFIQEIHGNNTSKECALDRSSATMAWCIYVESLLLNERLVQDIRETMGNKPNGTNCMQWQPYFGPNPSEEARMVFNEYVRVRWPIRVFALDPQINEQNIADVRSIYRQMQMAIALAFSAKEIGLSAALQSMRKLQRDRATVDLNRTAIGFGHGDDTFGWKFYPRFQTPPVEGNATVFFRDLIAGGPTDKQLEKSKQIEPGMRECTAIVLMPSFVPHVTLTTRSNWFKLGKQGVTADSIEDTVEYSRAIKQMETNANACVKCAHLYRDGEVDRLLARVHQLDRRLPLQTLECQVPIENSLGGFEIFSTGTRELAPELNGWYGSPGYDPVRGGQMFFAGDSFSVSNSRLIVGNQQIPFRLLSRQIMEVTLPAGLAVSRDRRLDEFASETYSGYVDAHIATPYGVSGHLLIPVLRQPTAAAVSTPTLAPATLRVRALRKKSTSDANVSLPEIEKLILPPSLQIVDLSVPVGGGLEGPSVSVNLVTSSGTDRLADVNGITLSASQSPNRFVMHMNTISAQFNLAAGSIGQTLGAGFKDHLGYILRNNNNAPTTVNYETRVVVVNGSNIAAATGAINIIIAIE